MGNHVKVGVWGWGGRLLIAIGLGLLLVPRAVSAQSQQIGIGGTVTDTSGAALPGVTVDVSSPALIEKVRTTLTDGAGKYLVVGLDPGTYSVKFSLPGFSNVVREGVQLTLGFTASINAQLAVGAIAETITVSGSSPVVDVQNIVQQQVMSREVMDTIPTGKSISGYGLLIPGMNGAEHRGSSLSQDVGGMSVQNRQRLVIHGSDPSDQAVEVNGLDVSNHFSANSNGLNLAFLPDNNMQEIAFQYSGSPAQSETGGVRINMIPKEGGNRFAGSFFTTFSAPALQADNLSDELISKGLRDPNKIDQLWSFNPSIGGPVVREKVWFFLAHTSQRVYLYPVGSYHATDAGAFTYTPNYADRMLETSTAREQSLNVTLQATQKDKFKLYWTDSSSVQDVSLQGRSGGTQFVAPEAAQKYEVWTDIYQANWVRPQTNRLLFEAGFSHHPMKLEYSPAPRARVDLLGVVETTPRSIAARNGAGYSAGYEEQSSPKQTDAIFAAASYVTGGHNLRMGMSGRWAWNNSAQRGTKFQSITVANGAPIQASYYAPGNSTNETWTLGLYAQDQWRVRRMTLNAGLRFEHLVGSYPDQVRPPSIWVPQPFEVTGLEVLNWKDLQPRLGVAYDLFGTGKTALKGSLNRSGKREGTGRVSAVNPATTNRTMNRTWNDRTCVSGTCIPGDGIPQGDPLNPQPNGELLNPNTNLNFGVPIVAAFYDPSWAFGWGNRASQWEGSGSIEHELRPGLSVEAGYFYRRFINLDAVDNRAVGPQDYDEFQVRVPDDPLLPASVRGQLITLNDLKPTSIRPADTVTTSANNFGGRTQSWRGFDITTSGRVQRLFVQGGVSSGQGLSNNCAVLDALPEMVRGIAQPLESCDNKESWLTWVKLVGSYTLPYDLQVAATFQNQPGPERLALVTFSAAQIAAALGRPSTQGPQTNVNVIRPGTTFGDRYSQFDMRLTRNIRFPGNTRLRAMFDLYNVFNRNSVTSEIPTLGPLYLNPDGMMPGRLAKFAFQLDF